jgi:uncharacterized protein YkwD
MIPITLLLLLPPAAEKTEFKLPADLKALAELANKAREKEKLPALRVDPLLCKIAQAHAENMAKQEKMEHVLDGKGVGQRAKEAGYRFRSIGENVARAKGDPDVPAPPPADIHKMWMESKPHRENILQGKFQEVGLGMARGKSGTVYYAQEFGTRLRPR